MNVDFNRDSGEGQMCPKEREALYNIVVRSKPDICCEVGTWKGGGSTYIIASALMENKSGVLFTCECDKDMYNHAVDLYNTKLSYLNPFVSINLGESQNVFPNILKCVNCIDLVMLDGKECASQTVLEYSLFNPFMKIGSILVCHDWNTEKMRHLKTIIEQNGIWKNIIMYNDTATGFTIWEKNE